jgi:hypothetical protein
VIEPLVNNLSDGVEERDATERLHHRRRHDEIRETRSAGELVPTIIAHAGPNHSGTWWPHAAPPHPGSNFMFPWSGYRPQFDDPDAVVGFIGSLEGVS